MKFTVYDNNIKTILGTIEARSPAEAIKSAKIQFKCSSPVIGTPNELLEYQRKVTERWETL